jgi:hypothetical protein
MWVLTFEMGIQASPRSGVGPWRSAELAAAATFCAAAADVRKAPVLSRTLHSVDNLNTIKETEHEHA